MTAPSPQNDPAKTPSGDPSLLASHTTSEQKSWLPWAIAGVVVVLGLVALIVFSHHEKMPDPGGTQLAAADPYAASLPISNLKMSESSNFAGGKVTYVDGVITNNGQKTVSGVTVQTAFHNSLGELSQKDTMALNLIRTREPYIDTQPVSANPIKPGEQREFRLIYDHVTADWDGAFPEVRAIAIQTK